MRRKRWMVSGGLMLAGGLAAGLGMASEEGRDDPVRVYLVHDAQAPVRGGSSSGFSHGIRTFSVHGPGSATPTQVFGYLDEIDEHWVVLKQVSEIREGKEIWIPRERVQLIEFMDEANFKVMSGGQ
ncbi:MAG: hypothetical protein RIE32_07970 [Phycisphaerales bacterium]